jgi:glycopeptide antibiotics resistance protein
MKKSPKRNWTLVTFMAVLIIFGHWIDFYQMVMPGTLGNHAELMPFEFGIAFLFIGLIMWRVGSIHKQLSTYTKKSPFPEREHHPSYLNKVDKLCERPG